VRLLDVGAVDGLERQVPAERTHILSTGGMLDEARTSTASEGLVATEIGMLHQCAGQTAPRSSSRSTRVPPCPYMKMSHADKLLRSLRDGVDEITVDPQVAARARTAVERMVAIGTPSAVGE
jgi:quinolinate synthase